MGCSPPSGSAVLLRAPAYPLHLLGPVPGGGLSWGDWACEYLQVCGTWSGAGLVAAGSQGTLHS